MSEKLSGIVFSWLRELKIPVSKSYIKQQLLSHPDYPSLLSITDTLTGLGIENAAVQIEKEKLEELETPFLVHLNGNGGEFSIVKESKQTLQKEFLNRWSGIAVAAEKANEWRHGINLEWLQKDTLNQRKLLLTTLFFTGIVIISSFISFDWTKTGLLFIALAGIFVSWMIVSKDLGIENKMADQVCGNEADCNTVIHSDKLKLPFGIGWSDAGIIYFSFLLLTLVITAFTGTTAGIYPILVLLSLTAFPVTLVSFYYQWRIIKKWCRLCLMTIGLLWLQILILIPFIKGAVYYDFYNIKVLDVTFLILILLITSAAWFWLKPLLISNKKSESENFAFLRFKHNPEVFKALLEKQKKITINPDGLGITIGNLAAENTIIKVCNPYCGPCAKAHPVIDKLLEENKNLKVQVIFTADDDEKDTRAKPVKHLMALYEKGDELLMKNSLDDWYMADKKDYDAFAAKYTLNGELERQGDKLKAMKTWCGEVKIEFTPTFFVNGYQLPKQYTIEDVKYFL